MTTGRVTVAGHFGEWLQGRMGPDGPLVLVTMPCPGLVVSTVGVTDPAPPLFDRCQLDRFARDLNLPTAHWPPPLRRTMPPGGGAGASTATLVALARAAGHAGDPADLARACLAIEGATDPLMFPAPDALLWQSRRAVVDRLLPVPPACDIIGGFWGPPQRTDPGDEDFADIGDLVGPWRRATRDGDLAACAGLASVSADRCAARRGGGRDPLPDLARDLGALGHVRAHTGSARGLVFAPDAVPEGADRALTEAGLTQVLRFRPGSRRSAKGSWT